MRALGSWRIAWAMLGLAVAGLAATAMPQARAQSYPSRPIHLIVPFAPGGGTDILARLIGQRLTESWGQPVVVENRPGASGGIGSAQVARAAPDGYTLLMASTGALMAMAGAGTPGASSDAFDVRRDLAPITLAAAPPYLLVVHPSVPARSVTELVAYAKANPGKLNFGSSGTGAASHLAAELFAVMAGIKLVHVPYKGVGQAVADLLGGQVQLMFAPSPPVMPHIQSGGLRALAVSGAERSPTEPDLPTIAEAGVPGYEAVGWFGLLGPANLPRPLVDKINGEVRRILDTAEVKQRLAQLGAAPAGNTPDEFTAYINADIAKWTKLVNDLGIRMEN
jgi:tripartite-type tricarboxylate transporter receptor subunit TctC